MTSEDRQRIEQLEGRVARLERAVELLSRAQGVNVGVAVSAAGQGYHDEQVVDLIRRGKKIEAVKTFRNITGMGLKEAKDYVDDLHERIKRGEL